MSRPVPNSANQRLPSFSAALANFESSMNTEIKAKDLQTLEESVNAKLQEV